MRWDMRLPVSQPGMGRKIPEWPQHALTAGRVPASCRVGCEIDRYV
ncbi:hypothetical protein IE983_25545 [Enterobacter hormaechei]|uniref:Uncharacterized protein n=1 Tax=Enterobacter hormaechei TaxID=158836 RepID=A0A927DI35_9ENTR|nr:hypothetical protein [Enterobacter hormaechei]